MSFVTMLATDTARIDNPTWEDVERAIHALDGTAITEVMLSPPPPKGPPEGDHHMGIGGGKDGCCIVYITEDNLHFWNLRDTAKKNKEKSIRMTVGGQEGDYYEAQCVPREWALKVARDYFDHGRRADSVTWVLG